MFKPPHTQHTPWLAHFSHETQSYICYGIREGSMCIRNIQDLQDKNYIFGSHGWLLVEDRKTKVISLTNAMSMEKIQVPHLHERVWEAYTCVISASPIEEFGYVLFINDVDIIYWIRHWDGWKKREYKKDTKYGIASSTTEGGHKHCIVVHNDTLMAIEFIDSCPHVRVLERNVDYNNSLSKYIARDMVESCGDIFRVWKLKISQYIYTFKVSKFDLLSMKWVDVDSIGDRAIFLSFNAPNGSFSYITNEFGIRKDSIYFFDDSVSTICRFDMVHRSFTMFMLRPNMNRSVGDTHWMLPSFRQKLTVELRHESSFQMEENNKTEKLNEDSKWQSLLDELLENIIHKLNLIDRYHIALVCKKYFRVVRSLPRKNGILLGSPCLLTVANGSKTCTLKNPQAKEEYLLNTPSLPSKVKILFSKDGWLLMLSEVDNRSIFFFNILTKETINLPPIFNEHSYIFSFSSSPTSPECIAVAMNAFSRVNYISICRRGDTEWRRLIRWSGIEFEMNFSNPIYNNKCFYCLADDGTIGVYNPTEDTWVVTSTWYLEDFRTKRIHPIESEGETYSVWVEMYGGFVKVYKIDLETKQWEKIDNIGERQFYVGSIASLWESVKSNTEGRIYFQMIGDDTDFVFYSCQTRKLNSEKHFWDAEDYALACWIEPCWIKSSPNQLQWSKA